jgi:putative phosphoribosyl transferase
VPKNRRYRDRRHAGEVLADPVAELVVHQGMAPAALLVLALPRGGVPVAAPVAERLGVDLDVLLVRKVGMPGHEELALGAVADGGVLVRNDSVLRTTGIDVDAFGQAVDRAEAELAERATALRGDRPAPSASGRVVVLVDDGLATGATMRAAVAAVRRAGAMTVVVAVPVGAPEVCAELEQLADAVVCPLRPDGLGAVGAWYDDFTQTTDGEVRELLGLDSGS